MRYKTFEIVNKSSNLHFSEIVKYHEASCFKLVLQIGGFEVVRHFTEI